MTTSTPLSSLPVGAETRTPAADLSFLPRRRITGRTAIWSGLLAVGLVCPLTLLCSVLPLPVIAGGFPATQARFLGYVLHPGELFFKAVIVMPLLEESFYRGLVLQLLRRYLPTWGAVLLSTGFFAATHLGAGSATALNAALLGLLFSGLVIRTGSLVPSMLGHAAFNLSWLFLIGPAFGLTAKILDPMDASVSAAYPLWWIGVSLALVLAAWTVLTKSHPQRSIDG